MTPPTYRRQTQRKSLKQCLKDLFQRSRLQSNFLPKIVGSGILRKADRSAAYLPDLSRISLFPDFESSRFDIDSYSVSIPNHFDRPDSEVDRSSISRWSLLPGTRLSLFNLNQSYVQQGRTLHVTYLESVPKIFLEGASRQASLVSFQSSQLRPRKSTLRIRKSIQSLRDDRWSQSTDSFYTTNQTTETPPRNHVLGSRKEANQYPILNKAVYSSISIPHRLEKKRVEVSKQSIPTISLYPATEDLDQCPKRENQLSNAHNSSVTSIRHFLSFCVLDTHAPGCPITATSEDLRYVFDVGEQFFLNNQECKDTSMDIVTGFDAAGNEVTHLVLFSPLVSPSSGRSRFMLAALIDVTHFIKDAATVPELDAISESTIESELSTPVLYRQAERLWRSPSYELSCEDLLGGCFIDESKGASQSIHPTLAFRPAGSPKTPRYEPSPVLDDIWMDLAHEARNAKVSPVGIPRLSGQSSSPSNASVAVDDVLDSFMSELQQLYSNFFLLAKSPLDDDFYEISNVSPAVFVSKDYVHGHLSHSSPKMIAGLSAKLGGSVAFTMQVRWGIRGEEKGLYCIPLFGQRSITWICMLVDRKLGDLWELEEEHK